MRALHPVIIVYCLVPILILSGCAKAPKPQPAAVDTINTNSIGAGDEVADGQAAASNFLTAWQSTPAPKLDAANGAFDIVAAVRQAAVYHPSVKEAKARLVEQDNAVTEARSGYRPSFSWGVDGLASRSSSDDFDPSANVNVSQMLYDFGKVSNRVNIAEAGVEERRSQVLRSIDDIARETAYVVTEVNRNRALQKVAREQIKDTRDILRLVEARAKSGAVTQSDVFQAKARVQAADAAQAQIAGELLRWERSLAYLTGVSGKVNNYFPQWLSASCSATSIDWDNLSASMKINADHKAAVAQLSLSRAEALPTLSLDGGVGVGLGRQNDERMDYSLGIKLKGNLYNGGATSARQRMAEAALVTVQTTKDRIRLEIQQSLDEAASQVGNKTSLYKTLQAKQKNLVQTKALYSKQFLDLGTRTLLDLLNVDQELHLARMDAHNAEFDLHRLNIDCLYYRGKFRSSFGLAADVAIASAI